MREQPHGMGNSTQSYFDGNRDLFFDFLGGTAREKSDDLDLRVGHIRKCFDRQRTERRHSPGDKQSDEQEEEKRLVQRELCNPPDHGLPSALLSSSTPLVTTRSPGRSPDSTTVLPSTSRPLFTSRRRNRPVDSSTRTYERSPSVRIALDGTVKTFRLTASPTRIRANISGFKRPLG